MKKIVLLVFATLFLPLSALAHPPTDVEIEYILDEGQLHVYMDHLSRDHRKHYIRKTVIFVNDQEVATESNRQQIDPNVYAFSIGLEAKENDTISVKAYCSEGGVGEATVTVTKAAEGETSGEVKAQVEEYKNKDRSGDVYGSKEEVFEDKSDVYKK